MKFLLRDYIDRGTRYETMSKNIYKSTQLACHIYLLSKIYSLSCDLDDRTGWANNRLN